MDALDPSQPDEAIGAAKRIVTSAPRFLRRKTDTSPDGQSNAA
ncbi:hypothetical protein N9L47_13135 [Rhodobacteraceae bacterium]|nr:hypothetical protein [Paracoccaceae bacterium]